MATLKNTTINDTGYFKLGEKANFTFTGLQNLTMFFFSAGGSNEISLYFYDNSTFSWFYIKTE